MSATSEEAPGARSASSPRKERLRVLLRSGTFMAGIIIVGFWIICALFGNQLAPQDPYADDLLNSLDGPSADHWFGTDSLGRDIFSRVILSIAPLATILGTILGTALGLVTGYFRGFIDDAIGRVVDAFLALPLVIIALLALVALGTSNTTVVVVIGVVFA